MKGERVRGDILLLTGVLLLILCSESAFCGGSLNAGSNAFGSGSINIGETDPDFTGSSGTITLNGNAHQIKTNCFLKHNLLNKNGVRSI